VTNPKLPRVRQIAQLGKLPAHSVSQDGLAHFAKYHCQQQLIDFSWQERLQRHLFYTCNPPVILPDVGDFTKSLGIAFSVITTAIFLLAILVMGMALLKFFGISLPVMQVAGGFVLAAMGWSLTNQGESDKNDMQIEVDSANLESLEQNVFYPLTFPITAGLGCIVVMVTLSAHVSTKGILPSIAAHA
jgi:hypothetical protein